MNKAVFLDRDGVINADREDYVKNVAELEVFPYAPAAIRRLNDAGFKVIVISNQQGVGKGVVSEEDLLAIQDEITRRVEEAGGDIAAFYHCLHLASDECSCRKPEPGLLLQAAKDHGIDLGESFMIGDSERDVVAGKRAGCETGIVLTGGIDPDSLACKPDFVAMDLAEAAEFVVGAVRDSEIPH